MNLSATPATRDVFPADKSCDFCNSAVDPQALSSEVAAAGFIEAIARGAYDDIGLTEEQQSVYQGYCCSSCAKKVLTS